MEPRGQQAQPFDQHAVRAFFAERAAGVDAAQLDVHDGLRWLAAQGLLALDLDWRQRTDSGGLTSIGSLIAAVAEQCLASAFAVWCQRMVIEYVGAAVAPDFPRGEFLPRLLAAEMLGSTALGNGMAHLVLGSPLTVRLEHEPDAVTLNGSIDWASNLLTAPDAAVTVVAAEDAGGQSYVVALPLDALGVAVAPYPRLLALQATRSSSVVLVGVRLPANLMMSPLDACLPRVRPTLLVLQTCFCQGLARASLEGAAADVSAGINVILQGDLEHLRAKLTNLERRVGAQLRFADAGGFPCVSSSRHDGGCITRQKCPVIRSRCSQSEDIAQPCIDHALCRRSDSSNATPNQSAVERRQFVQAYERCTFEACCNEFGIRRLQNDLFIRISV